MAENPGVHRVPFENATTETVTFIVESGNGPQTAFTLIPRGPFHYEEVQTPLTYEELRLVVGENSNGHLTNEFVSADELAGLAKVVVVKNSGNNFVLEKHPRKSNEGPSLTKFWRRLSWFRNEGATRDTLGV